MASCELCGKNPATLKCSIEGTIMNVCNDCSRFGDVKGKSNVKFIVQQKRAESKEPEYSFIENYGLAVKNARERLKLSQEDFAKKISEHKSLIHQVESGHMKPSITLARKLEKSLNIKIVEEIKGDENSADVKMSNRNTNTSLTGRSSGSHGLTLGDLMNMKKK